MPVHLQSLDSDAKGLDVNWLVVTTELVMDEVLIQCRKAFVWQATLTNHVTRYVVKVRDGAI